MAKFKSPTAAAHGERPQARSSRPPARASGCRCSARRKHIYAQIIDDVKGETLVAASSLEKPMREGRKAGGNVDAAKAVGKLIAERAQAEGHSRTSCSTAAAISITGASRRWLTLPARAASISDLIGTKNGT